MPVDVSAGNNVIDIHAISDPNGLFQRALGTISGLLSKFSVSQNNSFFLLLARLFVGDSTLEIGKMDPLKMYTGIEMLDLQILTHIAEGHQELGYKAAKPDLHIEQGKHSGLTAGNSLGAGADKKQHLAFRDNPNQYQGADDRKPQHPNQMSSEEIAEGALKAQQIEPQLTPSQTFTNTHTPSPAPAPMGAPTPSPGGSKA